MQTRVLTGITTTGTPHLGNYVGAIRPAIEASRRDDVDAFFFMADYHALIKSEDARASSVRDWRSPRAGWRLVSTHNGSRSTGSRTSRKFPS